MSDPIRRLKLLAELAEAGDPSQALETIERIQSERSLYKFIQQGWRYIDPAPFTDGWHIEAVCEHLEALCRGEIRHLLINQPPRTMKSISVSVALCPWVWCQPAIRSPARTYPPTPPTPPYGGSHSLGPIHSTSLSLTGPIIGTPVQRNILKPIGHLGPRVSFLYASYGQALSLRDSVKSRRLLGSPWYARNWKHIGLVDDMNTKTRFDNSEGGYRLATSVGGSLTGEGAEVICIDDPHNTVDIESDVTREGVLQWWDEAMSTRLNDPKTGSFICVMQRLHERDLSGHIISKNEGDWVHLMIPMEFEPRRWCFTSWGENEWGDPRGLDDEGEALEGLEDGKVVPGTPMAEAEGELLWPERFGREEVDGLKRSLGPFAAAGQLQQSPTPRGGGIIKESWWQVFPPAGDEQLYTKKVRRWDEQLGENVEREVLSFPPMEYVIAYADTAYTEKEENDYSACAVVGVWRDKGDQARLMLMKAWQDRLELHKLVQKLAHESCVIAGKYGRKNAVYVDRLVVENKASGKSVMQEIIRLFGNEKWMTSEGGVKGDKVARAYSIQYLFADGMMYAPDRAWVDKVIQECSVFPKGEHDDMPDAVFGAIKWLRDNGLIEMRREREIYVAESMRHRARTEALYDC